MTQGLRDLLASKKFLASLVAMLCWAAARFGFAVDPVQATELIVPLVGFVLAQGVADHGKGAAQITADAAATAGAPPAGIVAGPAPLPLTPPSRDP